MKVRAVDLARSPPSNSGRKVRDVAFACGSGGTAAGLAVGMALCPALRGARLHAFMVCDDAAYFLDQIHLAVAGQVPDGAARGGVLARVRALLRFHDGLGEGGQYGVSTAAELRFLARVSRQCGIVLDPTYGGKAFYSLARMLATPAGRAHFVAPDSALFVHTGDLLQQKLRCLLVLGWHWSSWSLNSRARRRAPQWTACCAQLQ